MKFRNYRGVGSTLNLGGQSVNSLIMVNVKLICFTSCQTETWWANARPAHSLPTPTLLANLSLKVNPLQLLPNFQDHSLVKNYEFLISSFYYLFATIESIFDDTIGAFTVNLGIHTS